MAEGLEFGGGAGNEEYVEALSSKLNGVFFADAIGGAGHKCPAAFGAEGAELGWGVQIRDLRVCFGRAKRLTDMPGNTNRLKSIRKKLNAFAVTKVRPIRAKLTRKTTRRF